MPHAQILNKVSCCGHGEEATLRDVEKGSRAGVKPGDYIDYCVQPATTEVPVAMTAEGEVIVAEYCDSCASRLGDAVILDAEHPVIPVALPSLDEVKGIISA